MRSVRPAVLFMVLTISLQAPSALASEAASRRGYVDELYASFQAAGPHLMNLLVGAIAAAGIAGFYIGKRTATREFYALQAPGISFVGGPTMRLRDYAGASPAEKIASVVKNAIFAGQTIAEQTLDDVLLGEKGGISVYFRDMQAGSFVEKFFEAKRFIRDAAEASIKRIHGIK